jgi:putative two-component system response regulator
LEREGYRTVCAVDGFQALEQITHAPPDLVLLDSTLPLLDGLGLLNRLRSHPDTQSLPVIFLSHHGETEIRALARAAGASEFLAEPVDTSELLARVQAQLELRSVSRDLRSSEEVLYSLARIIELRDAHTLEHTSRVAGVSVAIGRVMGLDHESMVALQKGAMLHDIGMVLLPDALLLKPGPLDEEEMKKVREHVQMGMQILSPLQSLGPALAVVLNHHERWDGKGYPDGLAGEAIPLLARIVAVADRFDAIRHERPYHPERTPDGAFHVLREIAGTELDPAIVAIALDVLPEIL